MPRLDNTDIDTLRVLSESYAHDLHRERLVEVVGALEAIRWGGAVDIAAIIGPLDVCMDCAPDLFCQFGIWGEVPHPNYEDDDYECCLCQRRLTDDDN